MIMWVPYIRDPQAPTQEEIHGPNSVQIANSVPIEVDFGMCPWMIDEPPADIGEPPSGWCSKTCHCGQPCGEFDQHNGSCGCLLH
jgi:hypothetical protein